MSRLARARRSAAIVSIYASTSVALTGDLRHRRNSDLDVFFIHKGSGESTRLSRIRKITLDYEMIRICREMSFPDFSGDGEYLEIHYIDDMLNALGSPADDFRNYFTARMLLLLESKPLFNDKFYGECIDSIINSYCRDFCDHEEMFRPTFIINDIIRFWKTLCLNYEFRRNAPTGDPVKRASNQIKNLKLKFSRMLTCFSLIFSLLRRGTVTPNDLNALVKQPPVDRLIESSIPEDERNVSLLLDEYAWFLELTGRPKNELIGWIQNTYNRDLAFEHALNFGNHMFEMIMSSATDHIALRFLVI